MSKSTNTQPTSPAPEGMVWVDFTKIPQYKLHKIPKKQLVGYIKDLRTECDDYLSEIKKLKGFARKIIEDGVCCVCDGVWVCEVCEKKSRVMKSVVDSDEDATGVEVVDSDEKDSE
jgi:hypothetical protein